MHIVFLIVYSHGPSPYFYFINITQRRCYALGASWCTSLQVMRVEKGSDDMGEVIEIPQEDDGTILLSVRNNLFWGDGYLFLSFGLKSVHDETAVFSPPPGLQSLQCRPTDAYQRGCVCCKTIPVFLPFLIFLPLLPSPLSSSAHALSVFPCSSKHRPLTATALPATDDCVSVRGHNWA